MNIMILLAILWTVTMAPSEPRGYYRFPALGDDGQVVFAAEGDLWLVGSEGGPARRLTSHLGEESHPVVSPDGSTLAFSAAYEGPREVYTMPLVGGLPARQTYEASDSIATAWTPSGRLAYATREFSTLPDYQMVLLDLRGGQERVPLSQASEGSYSGDGSTLYFVRPSDHRNDTKRYQGGRARKIWSYRQGDREAVILTQDHAGESHSPMWWNGRIYYVCDRDGTMNVWSMSEKGRDHRQHTRHQAWDVKTPSLRDGRVVYQLGADLRILDLRSGQDREVPINLASDFDQLREKWVSDPMEYLTSAHLHPEGEAVVLTSRGRVFVAPSGEGRMVRVSRKDGVRYRDAVFMPDGKQILALSDESGEFEFHTLPANGVGEDRSLTSDGTILRFQGYPSPDGKKIASIDKNNDLWIVDGESGSQTRVSSNREGAADPSWSPDSRWLAYSQASTNTYLQLWLYEVESGRSTPLTSDRTNSRSAAWDPEGGHLYFLSDRNLRSWVGGPWGTRQPEAFFDLTWKAFAIPLRKGVAFPFQAPNELEPERAKSEAKPAGDAPKPVEVDLEGIERRVRAVPLPPGNYRGLEVNDKGLFVVSSQSGPGQTRNDLVALAFRHDAKPETVVEDIRDFELSANRRKLLIRKAEAIHVIDAAPSKAGKLAEGRVDLRRWSFPISVREDFRQLYIDAWRMERDFFYDPGMHGIDWNGMRDKYLPLVERVTNRAELSDLIGQLVSELSALHVSVRGGDHRSGNEQVSLASLGARLARDEAAGGYRIEHIYATDPDYPEEQSPLADPGLEISERDVIEAINGVPALSATHPNALLRNQHDQQVLLRIRPGSGGPSREVVVVPTSGESQLRYREWQYTRRLAVEEAGEGEIGYVHLSSMGGRNLTEWYREFYPVFDRKGLIIDVRHNTGGNIDSLILGKLLRKAWFFWQPRVGEPYWNMPYAFRGHMVVLVDAETASDGEAFAEGFRRLGLGKVIGSRTWGGEIWLSSNNQLTDWGLARAPQTGVYGPEREWLIEGHGVVPDIEADNPPHATFKGRDAQLETAVRHLRELIEKHPIEVPKRPSYPDKSFRLP